MKMPLHVPGILLRFLSNTLRISNCGVHFFVSRKTQQNGPVAQLVEQGTFNPKVTGSTPVRPINNEAREDFSSRAFLFTIL